MVFGRGRDRRLTWLGTVVYSLFLILVQFEHHDIVCHLRNPQHCTACVSSQLGSDPQALTAPLVSPLTDAGQAISTLDLTPSELVAVATTGRSPPQHA